MSDSEDSSITYTVVSSPFRGLSDIRSPGVDGPPVMPEDPYAYVVAAFQRLGTSIRIPRMILRRTLLIILLTKETRAMMRMSHLMITRMMILILSGIRRRMTVDHAPSAKETGPFETDESAATPPPHPAYRVTARMSIRYQIPISLPLDTDIARLIAIPTLPPSPLSPLSSPLPQIPSPPLPLLSPPPTDPTYEEAPLGYRAARLQWRESSAAAAARLREPVRDDLYRFVDTIERGEGSTPATIEFGYGIKDAWDDLAGAIQEIALTTVEGVNQRMTELSTTFDQETSMIYAMIEEKRDEYALQRVRVNGLFRDRRYHAHTARLIEGEARASRMAWAQSMNASDAARSGVIALRTQVLAQQTEITDLWAVDHRFQTIVRTQQEEIRELRAAYHKLKAQLIQALTTLKSCQTQLTAALGRIQILEAARVPAQPEGVAKALAAPDADRNTNGDDSHVSGISARRTKRVTCECTYPNFMKCQPLNFKGTKGVVELTLWFEKMETVFRISNYSVENQIKFSTCTLLGSALTWWNSHIITVGPDVAYAMTCVDLKKKMSDKYCPWGEIKKLEDELWNLRVKSNDVVSYNQRFQELALLCVRMFHEVSDKIERYVGGLPEVIHGSVVASRPKTMQEAIEMANELMDKRNNTWVERQAENKRKFDDTSRNNQTNNVPCAPKCHKCNKVGHFARDCKSTTNVNTANNQRGNGTGQKPTCYECGSQGHFRKDCPKFKNNNHGTQGGKVTAPAKVYAIGRAGTNPNSNVITGTFLLNNFYASILFDIGFDRSFVSTAFSSQIAITPTTLDHYYDVELADGRIIRRDRGNETRLNILSCTKTQKYMLKGFHVFLAYITTKETEDKSEKKRLEDVAIGTKLAKILNISPPPFQTTVH
nr:hypothetical protein [Tanacetum cinerariifolium]